MQRLKSEGDLKPSLLVVIAVACLGMSSCETASSVTETQDSPTRTAPAKWDSSSVGPGPRDPDAPEEFTTTESGLKYRILRKGKGPKPTSIDLVTVNYKGWLDGGDVFDSSYERGVPFPFSVMGGVIPGWTEGIQYVGEGGMIELEIPPHLGYGPQGAPPKIPPNATLHFIIELLEIK